MHNAIPGSSMAEVTVPLRTVLGRQGLGMTVIVSPEDPDVPVRWAHPSEVRDPVPYLLGSELLLTAGVNFPTEPSEIDRYVDALVRAGVSALGFGLTPVYDAVPDALVESCWEKHLPLLSIPEATPFLAVSRAVGDALSEAQNAELRRLSEAEMALTRAATRANPVTATLDALAKSLRCWVVLLSADGRVADSAGHPPNPPPEVLRLAARVRDGTGPRSASTRIGTSQGDDLLVLHPVESAATSSSVLIAGRRRDFTVADRAVLAVAVAVLGVLDRERATRMGRTQQMLTRLLLAPSRQADPTLASVLEVPEGGHYRVLHTVPRHTGGEAPAGGPASIGTPLIEWSGRVVRAIVAENTEPLDALDQQGWLAGLSEPVPADGLPEADRQAEMMLHRATVTDRTVSADPPGRALSEVVDRERATRFAERTFAPIAANPSPPPDVLLRTLRSWLAHHGSWHHSSTELGVHRNSVRHRIKQAERLLDLELADPQRRMELWFALQWLPETWPHQRP